MNSAALDLTSLTATYPLSLPRPRESGQDRFIIFPKVPTASVSTKELFLNLSKKWKAETAHFSFITQRLTHPNYRKILSMGPTVVPYILEELEKDVDHWFHALVILTGENPIPRDFKGSVNDAAQLWIDWGHKHYAY